MALIVSESFETLHGVNVQNLYWRWTGLNVDVINNRCNVNMSGYVNESAFTAGKLAIAQKSYLIEGMQFGELVLGPITGTTLSDVISNAIYQYAIGNDSYFTNATDTEAIV